MRRFLLFLEILLVLALFLAGKEWLGRLPVSHWQAETFGAGLLSSTLLFLGLPLLAVWASRRGPGGLGLPEAPRAHLKAGLKASGYLLPATTVFPIVGALGSAHTEWLGAALLSFGFGLAGWIFMTRTAASVQPEAGAPSWSGVLRPVLGLLALGLAAAWVIQPWWPLGARLVRVFVFVGFLEELFFRGYLQTRLNDALGRPFRWRNIQFGYGVLIAAVVFGLFHPLSAPEPAWAWGLWTGVFGLVLGLLREKTGSCLAPAVVHAVLWLPGVFFGPG